MFKRVLSVITGEPTPYDRLKQAKATRASAQTRLDEEKEAAKRVQDVIDQATLADRAARKAYATAHAAVVQWGAEGADPAARHVFEKLEAKAAELDRRADVAQTTAQAARTGLPAVDERVRQAEIVLRDCGTEIGEAVEAILLADVEPQLAAVERAAAAYADAMPAIRALLRVTRSGTTRELIRETLGRSEIPTLLDCEVTGRYQYGDQLPSDVMALVKPLEERIRELRQDPLPRVLQDLAEERERAALSEAL